MAASTRTGLAAVDRVLAAIESNDQARLRELIAYFERPCIGPPFAVTGRPPFCRAGEPTGTLVAWFFTGGTEGESYRIGEVPLEEPAVQTSHRLVAVSVPSAIEASLGAEYTIILATLGPQLEPDWYPSSHYLVRESGLVGVLYAENLARTLAEQRTYLLAPRIQ